MPESRQYLEEPFSSTLTRKFEVTETLFSGHTGIQQVDILDTHDYGVTMFLDRRFQTSERDEFFYHESLVHPAMMSHPRPERVLIIGGGDGGTLEEVAKYRSVGAIHMVELDGTVVEVSRRHLTAICGDAFDDPRLDLTVEDGRRFVERTGDRFDVILLDLTDPIEEAKYVYTREFYDLCAERLVAGGVLALHNNSPFFYPETFNVTSTTVASAFAHVQQFVTYVPGYMLDFAFSICSQRPLPDPDPASLRPRFEAQKLGPLQLYSPEYHAGLFALPEYARRILGRRCPISTDEAPYTLDESTV